MDELDITWGNYPQGRRVHPVRKINGWRRARVGDKIVVAMRENGRRFFVWADDPTIGMRMPIGTIVNFAEPLHVAGMDHGYMKAPSGCIDPQDAAIGLKEDRIFGERVMRLTFAPVKIWPIFLNYAYTAQCMVVKSLPDRSKPH